jgi:chitin synthase
MFSMIVFSIIMAYTIFCSFYIVIIQLVDPKTSYELGNNIFTNVIVSMGSTVGLYFLMSTLYLDPWHLITSSVQYFALLPSYICTLQVYAFCNTHDVTWGTKGDNVIHTDLGAALAKKGNIVELEMPSEQLDIDSGYDEALRNLRDRVEVAADPVPAFQLQEDYYRAVRTYVVAVWMAANGVLAMAVSESYDGATVGSNFYLKLILWSVAALALFRALGSSAFGLVNIVHMVAEGRMKMDVRSIKVPDWVSESGSRVTGSLSWLSGSSVGSSRG